MEDKITHTFNTNNPKQYIDYRATAHPQNYNSSQYDPISNPIQLSIDDGFCGMDYAGESPSDEKSMGELKFLMNSIEIYNLAENISNQSAYKVAINLMEFDFDETDKIFEEMRKNSKHCSSKSLVEHMENKLIPFFENSKTKKKILMIITKDGQDMSLIRGLKK